MTAKPPPAPAQVLTRVLGLATFDGRMLLYGAGAFAILSATSSSLLGALVGCLAAGTGAIELHGANELRRGRADGVSWLVASQLTLMVVVEAYALSRMGHFDEALWQRVMTPWVRDLLSLSNIPYDHAFNTIRVFHELAYGAVAVGTLIVQGGLAWYYHTRRESVRLALQDSSLPPTL